MSKVLITGCAGFIGSNFTSKFRKMFPEAEIVGIDNFATGRRDAVNKKIIFYEGSMCDEKFLDKMFKKHKPEYVFHFAYIPRVSFSVENPAKTTQNNIGGTAAVLEKCRDHKIKRVIYSSSSSVYGGAKILPTKEKDNPVDPKSPYALQKCTDELMCKMFGDLYGLDTVCLRYFNVFGPGQYGDSPYSTVVSAWLAALFQPSKKKSFLEGDGKQSRDFCYVDNVVDANILAMQSNKNFVGDTFNIAHGERTNLLEVKKLIEKYSGKKIELEKRTARLGDVRHTYADVSKAKKGFGYKPKIDFEEGLKKTVEWWKTAAHKH
ncbi:MAG: NAD-dependent epimerase/dehydratase family protein [bacterium]|nr:NAD-dependent epimerase/dehydratase family protein [bacterium]